MSGILHLRLEQSDLTGAVLSCHAVVQNKRADKTLTLKVGQEHRYVMPDELFDLATDYVAARRGHEDLLARVKELEEERQHLLIRPDSTLSYANAKMREQNDSFKLRTQYMKAYENLAKTTLEEKLNERKASEVERIAKELGITATGNKEKKISTLLQAYTDGDYERRFQILQAANVMEAYESSSERYSDEKARENQESEKAQNAADVRRMSEELKIAASKSEQADTRSYQEKKDALRPYKDRVLELQDAAQTNRFKADQRLVGNQHGVPNKRETDEPDNRETRDKDLADDNKTAEKDQNKDFVKSDADTGKSTKEDDMKSEGKEQKKSDKVPAEDVQPKNDDKSNKGTQKNQRGSDSTKNENK